MGIDDLIPDDADPPKRGGGHSTQSKQDEDEYVQEFHSDLGVKKFTEEQWVEIKKEIKTEYPYVVDEICNMEAEKRHNVIHEIAVSALTEDTPERNYTTDIRCVVCGNDCSRAYIEIEGEPVHEVHNAIQIAGALDKEVQSK
jgi:hypothetical protein